MISPIGFARPAQSAARRAAARLCAIAIIMAFGFALAAPVFAHSWYPAACCSEVDCSPLDPKEVKATPAGWLIIKDRVTVPYDKARPSPDGLFHICRNDFGRGTIITIPGQPACFWAPEGAS